MIKRDIKSNLVSVSNDLVTASYSMTLLEKRLLILAVSYVNNAESMRKAVTEGDIFTIKVSDYAEIYGIEYETAKDELAAAVERLYQQDLTYVKDGKPIRTRWVSYLPNYNGSTHEVELAFSPGISPLISELSEDFSSYRLLFLAGLQSVYSIRLYWLFYKELRKSHKKMVKVYYTLDHFRCMLRLDDKYSMAGDFLRRVIKEPLDEIEKHTNISVYFTNAENKPMYVKQGRKIIGLYFWVQYKDKQSNLEDNSEINS